MTTIHVAPPRVLPARSIPRVQPRPRGRRELDELERRRYVRERKRADLDVMICSALGACPGGSFAGLGPFWASAFNPAAVAGCARYAFVAQGTDAVTYPSWLGNGHDFSSETASTRPAFASDGINGRPALVFDGTDDRMVCESSLASLLQGGVRAPCSIALVLQLGNPDALGGIFLLRRASSLTPTFAIAQHPSGTGTWYLWKRDDDAAQREPLGGATSTDPVVLTVVTDGTDVALRINGTPVSLSVSFDTVGGNLTLDRAFFGSLHSGSFCAFKLAADAEHVVTWSDVERLYIEHGLGALYEIPQAA